ncbi:hypothetical protein [Candidatus Protochlamydia phocaeensis]|uniref:hypothetical protein n=1 Tax=Candidatus Protochlamydia phocaeensis TaxID=1414722 RepID=UPI000838A3A5|nr:hypothetical protein [Candidatus Protochlamydia phocaeensis]
MIKYITTCFLFLFICFSSVSFANQIKENSCCIREVIGNKVYLNPTTVHIANNGIFINVGGSLHGVNNLGMDSQGVYIDATRAGVGDWVVGECPVCRDVTVFGVCMNDACPTKNRD